MQTAQTIDHRFDILQEIAVGGMGRIYKARDQLTGALVAVKVVGRSELAHRFLRESSLLSEISHPAIVKYVVHGRTETGEPYLAMEWLEGEDLQHLLSRLRQRSTQKKQQPAPEVPVPSVVPTGPPRTMPRGSGIPAASQKSMPRISSPAQGPGDDHSGIGDALFGSVETSTPATAVEVDLAVAPPPISEVKGPAPLSAYGLSIAETLQLGRRIASAMAELHRRRCVHRDIKPAKVTSVESFQNFVRTSSLGLRTAVTSREN